MNLSRQSIWAAAASLAVATLPSLADAQEAQRNASSTASAGGMCISPEVRQRVVECPSNAPRGTMSGEAPRSRLRTAKREVEEKKQGPRGPSIELDVATRMNRQRIQARAWQLLEREVLLLKRMVGSRCPSNAQCPDVLLRLAETHFERQQAINTQVRSLDDPIYRERQRKNANAVTQLMQKQRALERKLNEEREAAIQAYATLVQSHPNFPRMDEVLFSLAFGLEELRQFDRARQVYHRLIKGFPRSRFVPHAWLSFAEYYFNEGDMDAANQFYAKVLEFPSEQNPVYGYALYKSAWATYNLQDFRASLQKFVDVIEFATAHPEARDAENLARQSRRELVLPYVQVGRPARALEFFRRYTTSEDQALEVFESLAELYFDTGQWPDTIECYHKLIQERPQNDKTCYWQSRVASAIISSAPKPDQVREVERMVDLWSVFSQQNHSDESKQICKQAAASTLVELATAWHREAIGTESQPGTNDKRTMGMSKALYDVLLEKFPDMERMEFPDIDRRDWPSEYKIAYYRAELLWKMEEWAECGPAFDKVVELNPQGEYTADAAYAAVLCYNNLYQQQYQRTEREVRTARRPERRGRGQQAAEPEVDYSAREFTPVEQGMLNAFQRYVCFVPDSEELPTIKYRRARILYEANHFEDAAVLFRDIAWNHRDSELSEYAANLYLNCLDVIGTMRTPRRPECLDTMSEDIEPLKNNFCQNEEAQSAHPDLCRVLSGIECGLIRKKAEAYQTNREFKKAAKTYIELFNKFHAQPDSCGGRMDEVLWNAAINYEAARLVGKAIRVRKALIERFAESEYAKRSLYLVGANYHGLAFYEQAADYYEQFARRYPGEDGSRCTDADRTAKTCAVAHEALENAVFFRLGLGDSEKAIEDAQLFERNYRSRGGMGRKTSQIIFSLGSIYERSDDWRGVERHYGGFLRTYGRTALPNQAIRAHVQVGLSFWKRNEQRQARGHFEKALQRWAQGAAEEIGRLADVDDNQKALFLYEAKDAASEALFYLAEYKYADAKAIEFPAFRGTANLQRVNEWAQGEFKAWVERKSAAITAAATEYEKIAPLQIPEWEIAAAARIGEMWRSFVDEFRDAPVPDEIRSDPELMDAYLGGLDTASERFVQIAIERFEFCLITSTRVRWFNEFSRQCEQELNQLNPREYPLASELRGSATYLRPSLAEPRPVELGATSEDELSSVGGGT